MIYIWYYYHLSPSLSVKHITLNIMYINLQHEALWNYFSKNKNSNEKNIYERNSYPGCLKFNFPPNRWVWFYGTSLSLLGWRLPGCLICSVTEDHVSDSAERFSGRHLLWKDSLSFQPLTHFVREIKDPMKPNFLRERRQYEAACTHLHVQITLFLMPKITALKRHESGIASMWSILCFRPKSFRR